MPSAVPGEAGNTQERATWLSPCQLLGLWSIAADLLRNLVEGEGEAILPLPAPRRRPPAVTLRLREEPGSAAPDSAGTFRGGSEPWVTSAPAPPSAARWCPWPCGGLVWVWGEPPGRRDEGPQNLPAPWGLYRPGQAARPWRWLSCVREVREASGACKARRCVRVLSPGQSG